MERPAKRPRLLTPLDNVYNAGFRNQHTYYDTPDDELNDYEELGEEQDEPVYDPDQDLQRKRARVDLKLKSTFEAIFEKYGKDFDGIGDEIDMRTGEVVVNNGHILKMRHEMDAGDPRRRRIGQISWLEEGTDETTGSEEGTDETTGSEEDDVMEDEDEDEDDNDDDELAEEDEEVYDEEDALSDGHMMEEDDLILRGFAQASQQFMHRQRPQDPGPSRDRFVDHSEVRRSAVPRPSLPVSVLPSRTEILAQFGPQLGPEIAKYVSKGGPLENVNVEPAWRVPDIFPTAPPPPTRRPLIKSRVRQPESEPERSPSPENAPSIWAMKTSRSSKRFSRLQDELLLDFVADARKHGLNLASNLTWRQLESLDPRHDWNAWKSRYTRKFTYLQPGPLEESDLSTSETSANTSQMPYESFGIQSSFNKPAIPSATRPIEVQRPARIRKPAQRDGIVSWSEAVETIASIDPVGNAGLLDDVRRTTGYSFEFEHPVSSSSSVFPARHSSQNGRIPKQPVTQYSHPRYSLNPSMRVDSESSGGNDFPLTDSAFHEETSSTEKAPCPHADCRPYPTTLYRLERTNDEEFSPMCSHLLRVHRIAPFPCGESNCERKGARGYFMQKDLVRHVKQVHPYVAALHRLRGRVDPYLLDQTIRFERLYDSIEEQHPMTSDLHPRDSDFMSPQRPFSSHDLSSRQRFSFGSAQDPDKTLTPRASARAASEGASSMLVHASSATVRDIPSRTRSRERSSDFCDVQILDEDPFQDSRTSQREHASYREVSIELVGGEKSSSQFQRASRDSLPTSQLPKTLCNYSGCAKMISSHSGNMLRHLRMHQRRSTSTTASKKFTSKSKVPLAATIPNSQSLADELQSNADPPMSANDKSSSAPRGAELKNIALINRSYEFSDEEESIRPIVRRALRPAPTNQAPSLPHSFFAPTPESKAPQSATPPKPAAAMPNKLPSPKSKQPFTTPAAKQRRRKSALHNVFDSEDFDELSLGEDGFILLSARPRFGLLPKPALPVQVKREEPADQASAATSTKKRGFSSLANYDEIDELAEDDPSMSTPYRLGPISTTKPQPKRALEEHTGPSNRPIIKPKPKERCSNGVATQTGSSLQIEPTTVQTPKRRQQLPAKTSTPLIDLVKNGQPKFNAAEGLDAEISFTSELGSSPNSRRARTRGQRAAGTSSPLVILATPRRTWAERTVKQEDGGDSIVTPGGTLRRCGQDGFACERAFCFKCRSEDENMA